MAADASISVVVELPVTGGNYCDGCCVGDDFMMPNCINKKVIHSSLCIVCVCVASSGLCEKCG